MRIRAGTGLVVAAAIVLIAPACDGGGSMTIIDKVCAPGFRVDPNASKVTCVPEGAPWPVGTSPAPPPWGRHGTSAVIAARGDDVFAVGGVTTRAGQPDRPTRDAALLDLRTRRWTRLPDVPFDGALVQAAQWAGPNLVVTGVVCHGRLSQEHACGGPLVAASYSPADRRWRPLTMPASFNRAPSPGTLAPLFTDVRKAFFLWDDASTVAVDPVRGRWRTIQPALLPGSATCASPRFAAVIGGIRPGGPIGLRTLARGDETWSVLSPTEPPYIPGTYTGVGPVCDDDSVVQARGTTQRATTCAPPCASGPAVSEPSTLTQVRRFALATRQWSDVPLPASKVPAGATSGNGPYAYFFDAAGGPAMRLTTADGTWSAVAAGPSFPAGLGSIVWTGGLAVTHDSKSGGLVVYRPS